MTFIETLTRILMIMTMTVAGSIQIRAMLMDYSLIGVKGKTSLHPRLFCAWLTGVVPIIWILIQLWQISGVHTDLLYLPLFLYMCVWIGLLILMERCVKVVNTVKVLIPLLYLYGIGVVIQFFLIAGRVNLNTNWMRGPLFGIIGIGLITLVLINVSSERILYAWRSWWSTWGVPTAFFLFVGVTMYTILGVLIFSHISPISNYYKSLTSPIWWLAIITFLLSAPIVGTRARSYIIKPLGLKNNIRNWAPVFVFASFPSIACYLSILSDGTADMAPILSMATALFIIFIYFRELKIAFVLAGVALLMGYTVLNQFPDTKPMKRISDWQHLSRARSFHQLQTIQGVARGEIFGRGMEYSKITKGNLAGKSSTPLPETDAIWGSIGEIFGISGFFAIMLSFGAIAAWMLRRASNARDLRTLAWFGGTSAIFIVMSLATMGWPIGAAPIIGYAAPMIGGGISVAILWIIIIAVSVVLGQNESISKESNVSDFLPLGFQKKVTSRGLGIIVICGLWIIFNGISVAGINRSYFLEKRHFNITDENAARQAILNEWVILKNGKVCVNEAKIFRDIKKPSDQKSKSTWLERNIQIAGIKRSDDGHFIIVDPNRFFEGERTGLGDLLLAQKAVSEKMK